MNHASSLRFCWSDSNSFPLIFVWFLFGKGYARSTRRAVFIYALTPYVLMLVVGLVEWIGRL